jgi:AcrR family transcriptional regulator
LRAAREVFSELGYDAATFQAIASRADLTRPAINHYFANKRVLYDHVVENANETLLSEGMTRAGVETSLVKRLSGFFAAAMQVDSVDRSVAAFLTTSMLEGQRHAELACGANTSLKAVRAFVTWALADAIQSGEVTTDTDVPTLAETLVAVMWGMSFYAGYIGGHDELATIVAKLELVLANDLWRLAD